MNIKQKIKESPFGNFATCLGDIYSDPLCIANFRRLRNLDKRTAVLIGTPAHYNMGDHLLAANELLFLKEYCHFDKVIEIPTRIYEHNTKMLEGIIAKEVPIFITGGGWMGDVWPEDQLVIEQIIQSFKENPIFILPQTVYYSNKKTIAIENTKKVFREASSLTIMCRDKASYVNVKELFESTNIDVMLMPDMGLLVNQNNNRGCKRNYLLCCMREDRERLLDEDIKNKINAFAEKKGLEVIYGSTLHSRPVPIWQRGYVLKRLMKEFRSAEIVITDRLHGMIFATINGTKCIAFDNKTHKVSGVYDLWLKDKAPVIVIGNAFSNGVEDEIFDKIVRSDDNSRWNEEVKVLFKNMAEDINRKIEKKEEL